MFSCGNDHNIAIWSVVLLCGNKSSLDKMCYSTLQKRLYGHSSAVSQIRSSLNGDLLVSTAIDKTTRIWQVIGLYVLFINTTYALTSTYVYAL